jgi:DNA-binding response OmpR family regulator
MTPAESAVADRATGRVLVVEDDPHICELVLLHLRLEGLTTSSAPDGTDGLQKARTEPFDLVILDVMLPGLDGITVCRAIRRTHLKDLSILVRPCGARPDKVNGPRAAPTTT